ncbi:MAG TPA: hypothetical protein VHZ76_06160, partial [Gammaproteobacteria bacterium]|nr:hypothetical protein [Gammaproteobacteria bacterium]
GIIIEKEQETEEQKIDRLIKVIYSKIVNSSIPSSDVISELRVAFIYADTFAISKFCKRLVEYQSKLKSKENMQELEMLCRILYLEERNKSAKDPKLADGDLAGWLRFYLNLQQMHYQLTTKKNKSISLNEVFSQIDCLETANAIQCQWFIDKIAHGWPENLFAEVLNRYRQRYAMSRTSSVFYAYLEWEKLTRVLKKARNQADMVADIPYFNQVLTGLPEKEREVFLRRIHTVSSIEQRQWLVWAMFQCEVESFMHNPQMFLENSLVKPVTESCLRQALFSSAAESDFRMALPLDTEGLRYFVPAFTSNNPERRFSALGLRREEVVNILQNRKHDLEARKLISQEIYVTFSGEEFQDEVLEFKILRAALATHQRALEVLCESIIKYYYGNLNRVTPDNPEKIKHLLGSKKNDRKAQSWLTEIKQCEHQINNSKEVIAQAIVSVDFYERYLELIGRNANLGYFTALLCTQSLKNRSLIVAELVKNPEEPLKMVVRHIEPNKPIMFWAVVNRNNPFDFELILEETTPSSLLRLFLQADYNIRGFGQWLVSKGFPHTPNWKIVGTCLEEIAKGLIKFTPQFREEDQAYVLAIKIFLGWFNFQFQENIQILYNHLFVRNGNMEARLQYYSRIMSRIVTDEYLPAYFLQQFRFDATAASRRRESLTISDFITQAVRDEFKLFCQRAAIYAVEHNQVNLLKALVPPKQEIIFCYQQKFRLHREIETIEIQQAIVEGYYEILQKINSKSDPIIYLDVLKDQLRQKEIEIEQKLLTAFDPKNNANKGWLRRELLPGEEIPNEWKIEAKHNYAEKIKSEMMRYRLSEARILGVLMSKDELTLCLQE